MYAVIETGGKQYRVLEGSTLKVARLDAEVGGSVEIDKVLAIGGDEGVSVGRPVLEKAAVVAEVVNHGRGEKIVSYKYKRRKDSDRKVGHRQDYTEIRIKEIKGSNGAQGDK